MIAKHWCWTLVCVLGLALTRTAAGQTTVAAMEETELRYLTAEMLERLGYDCQTLAAGAVSQEQAERLIGAARSFAEDNTADLRTHLRAVATATSDLRRAESSADQILVASNLETLRNELFDCLSDTEAALADVVGESAGRLAERARLQWRLGPPLSWLDLSSPQREELTEAKQQRDKVLRPARRANVRSQIKRTWRAYRKQEAEVLGTDGLSELDQIRQNLRANGRQLADLFAQQLGPVDDEPAVSPVQQASNQTVRPAVTVAWLSNAVRRLWRTISGVVAPIGF